MDVDSIGGAHAVAEASSRQAVWKDDAKDVGVVNEHARGHHREKVAHVVLHEEAGDEPSLFEFQVSASPVDDRHL